MEQDDPNWLDSVTYRRHEFPDNTLDDAQLETRCPLDNGRCIDMSIPPRHTIGQLDTLPAEILLLMLPHVDIPSLTRFRSVNRRAMELTDAIPQYAALLKHCPNIVRAVVSVQADAYSCDTLYKTLFSERCTSCERFGGYLYLITCRRVCYMCLNRNRGYSAFTLGVMERFYPPTETQHQGRKTSRQNPLAANLPSIMGLPGLYRGGKGEGPGRLVPNRFRLFDRRAVLQGSKESVARLEPWQTDPLPYMAVITAPYLFDSGRQADWGYFCLGCKIEGGRPHLLHYKTKFSRDGMLDHIRRFGPVLGPTMSGSFYHGLHK